MTRTTLIALLMSGVFSMTAQAHPGSNILTTGSKAPRAATTPGVTYENAGGVHLFRGSPPANETEELLAPPQQKRVEIKIRIEKRPFRQIRKLRTQGFYSGKVYPTRRYTQGFYSGD